MDPHKCLSTCLDRPLGYPSPQFAVIITAKKFLFPRILL